MEALSDFENLLSGYWFMNIGNRWTVLTDYSCILMWQVFSESCH